MVVGRTLKQTLSWLSFHPSYLLVCSTCITQQKSCLSFQSTVQNWSRMNRLYVNRFSLSTILALPRQPIRTIGGHPLSSTFSGEPWEYMYSVIQASPVCRNKISIRSSVFWTLVFSIDVFVQFELLFHIKIPLQPTSWNSLSKVIYIYHTEGTKCLSF